MGPFIQPAGSRTLHFSAEEVEEAENHEDVVLKTMKTSRLTKNGSSWMELRKVAALS